MGAKASTANSGQQSPRTRTFSTSSSSEVVSGSTGFNLLRAIPGMSISNERQRARSLSSVPDLQASSNNHNNNNNEAISIPAGGASGIQYDVSSSADPDGAVTDEHQYQSVAGALGLGRVYTATSLPSHIWSLNGELCTNILLLKNLNVVNQLIIYFKTFLNVNYSIKYLMNRFDSDI